MMIKMKEIINNINNSKDINFLLKQLKILTWYDYKKEGNCLSFWIFYFKKNNKNYKFSIYIPNKNTPHYFSKDNLPFWKIEIVN